MGWTTDVQASQLRDQITESIRGCKSCFEQKLVRARTREPMLITDTPAEPFDKVSYDTVWKLPTTPNGNCHILTMLCYTMLNDFNAVATDLFLQYGASRAILTDRGGSLESKLMRKLEKLFNVKQLTTPGYRPQTNGSLERSHIILTDYVKHYASDYGDWDRLLPFAMFAYNTSVHGGTNFTPYELVFGRIARTPSSFDYQKHEKNAEWQNRRSSIRNQGHKGREILLILAVASTMMTTTSQETEGNVYRILPFGASAGLYYEFLDTIRRTISTWRITSFLDTEKSQQELENYRQKLKTLLKLCQTAMKDECLQLVDEYHLNGRLQVVTNLQREITREMTELSRRADYGPPVTCPGK